MAASTSNGQRTLLVVSGGREAVPAIREAQRLGLRVLVSDGAPDAPGFQLADAGLLASTYDPAATVEAARAYATRHRIDGVLAVAADVPNTVAAVADALGLVGPSLHSAHLASDKVAMKDRFREAGVAVPWYAPVASAEALAEHAAGAPGRLIVKPVDSRGARGVVRLLRGVDPAWAYHQAAIESPTGRVMVERFVDGPQLSTESVVVDGRCTTVGVSDRNYEYLDRFAPFVIENGGDLPTRLPATIVERVGTLVADAAAALGITHGTVKGDIVVGPDGPLVIELAARLSGGLFCTHEIPLATGVNLVEAAIRLALGEHPSSADLEPRWSRGVAQRYFFPKPGTVTAIDGVAAAAAAAGTALLEMTVGRGSVVRPITSHVCRGGVVITVGDTREQAIERAEAVVARVRIVTQAVSAPVSAVLH
ncbi:MAG TPA: ATP-grasp domain-containing protein [Candidatus Binatia bacterium]|jgi:biotin carboxylase|nr:ATP-grasp domain-containing protein [Candidatus Binatia bacterium]